MNEQWGLFLTGLFFGAVICGFFTFKIEEDRILSIQAQQNKALIEAQNKVIDTERNGNQITQKVTQEYEAKINALNANIAQQLQANPKHGMSKIPQPTTRTDGPCQIQLTYLQKWIDNQVKAFNK